MGKNSGGVTDWHKQQHKKQLIKNREARIAARDERVVQEKTVEDIRAEIRKVEHHHKNEQQRPHATQSKLDRLKKELKLVIAKEEADKQQRELTLQQKKDAQKYETKNHYVPLARPEVSIFYHPLMNPFGAPPPGQPHLYHRRGGGTTANLSDACSLDEQFLPPPPPPRPVQPIDQKQPPQRHDSHQFTYRQSNSIYSKKGPEVRPARDAQSISTEKASIDPMQLPNLPAPSAAVARSQRNKLSSDIWASNEEIQYEEQVSSISLEGIASTTSMYTQWYYKDLSDIVQGPFTTDQMRQWNQAGYFPIITRVSGSSDRGPWNVLKDVKQLKELNSTTTSNVQPINVSLSVQDRIAALRSNHTTGTHNNDNDGSDDDLEASVQMRIAALKAAPLQDVITDEDDHHEQNRDMASNDQQNGLTITPNASGIIDYNYNLDNSAVGSSSEQSYETEESKRTSVQVNDGTEFKNDTEKDSGFQNRLPPPPASENDAIEREKLLLYPIDDDHIVSYPVGDYATTIDNVPALTSYDEPYQYEYENEDSVYLPNEADLPVTGDYEDAVHEYMMYDNANNEGTDLCDDGNSLKHRKETEQPKKRIKIDDAVVALVPSRIRKR